MKKSLLIFASLSVVIQMKAQSIDDIIRKHIDAIGGLQIAENIKTLHLRGAGEKSDGTQVNVEIWKVNGKFYRSDIETKWGTTSEIIADSSLWFTSSIGGGFKEKSKIETISKIFELDCVGPLINYEQNGYTAELKGKVQKSGGEKWEIHLMHKNGSHLIYFIDPVSFLVNSIGYERPAPFDEDKKIIQTFNFPEYKRLENGYLIPVSWNVGGQYGVTIKFETLEINKELNSSLFNK